MSDISQEFLEATTDNQEQKTPDIKNEFMEATTPQQQPAQRTGQDPYVENTKPDGESTLDWVDRQAQSLWRIGGGMVRDTAEGAVDTLDWAGDSLANTLTFHQMPDAWKQNLEESNLADSIPEVEQPVDGRGRAIRDIGRVILGSVGGAKGATAARSLMRPDGYVRKYLSRNLTDYVGGAAGVAGTELEGDQTAAQAVENLSGISMPEGLKVSPEDSEGMRKLKLFADDLAAAGVVDAGARLGKAMMTSKYDVAEDLAPKRAGGDKIGQPSGQQGPTVAEQGTTVGNINLRNIYSTDEVKNLIKETEEANRMRMEAARGGKQSWEETEQLAANLGMSADVLLKRRNGEAFNASEALAARQVLAGSADDVMKLAKQIKDSGGAENAGSELVSEFRNAMYRHVAIQEQVTGMTAEAGRALNSFNIKAGSKEDALRAFGQADAKDMNIDRMVNNISRFESQGSFNAYTRNAVKARSWDMIKEGWYLSLLSGVSTHIVNVLSNALFAPLSAGEKGVAAGIGKMRQGMSRIPGNPMARQFDNTDRIYGSEVAGRAVGMVNGTLEGIDKATRALWDEVPTDQRSKIEVESHRAIPSVSGSQLNNYSMQLQRNLQNQFGVGSGRTFDISKVPGIGRPFREGQQRATVRGMDIPLTGEYVVGGRQLRTPSNMLIAGDELFKAIHQRGYIWQEGWRRATEEGLKGQKRYDAVRTFVEDPPKDVLKGAVDDSRYWTFMDEPGKTVKGVMQAVNASKVGFFFAPFVRTPARLLHHSFERTPVGFIFPEVRKAFKQGGRARDEAAARMMTGGMLGYLGFQLYQNGNMTGSTPADRAARSYWYSENQPYSVRLPGDDKMYQISRIDPFGLLIGFGADAAKIYNEFSFAQNADTEDDLSFAFKVLNHSIAENMLNKTWLQGPANIIESASGLRDWQYTLNQLAGTAVPTIVAHHTKALDPTLRDAKTISEAIMSRYPGGAQKLYPRLDVTGKPVKFDTPLGPGDDDLHTKDFMGVDLTYLTRMASPIYAKEMPRDPVVMEHLALEYFPDPPGDELRGVKLNDHQAYLYNAWALRLAHNDLSDMVTSPYWNTDIMEQNPGIKKKFMSKIYEVRRRQAEALLMDRFPTLEDKFVESKRESIVGDRDRYNHNRRMQELRNPENEEDFLNSLKEFAN